MEGKFIIEKSRKKNGCVGQVWKGVLSIQSGKVLNGAWPEYITNRKRILEHCFMK